MKPWQIALIALPFIALGLYYQVRPLSSKVLIRNTVITTEVAITESQKQKGLGGRTELEPDRGMLFVYDHKETYNFWMRDMKFPLDFIWIDGSVVADITQNVPPPGTDGTPVIIKPDVMVDKVLEVNAGFVKQHNITIGDTVIFRDR